MTPGAPPPSIFARALADQRSSGAYTAHDQYSILMGLFSLVVPALGVLVNATMIVARVTSSTAGGRALAIAGTIIGGIVILYFIGRARSVTEASLAAAEEEAA